MTIFAQITTTFLVQVDGQVSQCEVGGVSVR